MITGRSKTITVGVAVLVVAGTLALIKHTHRSPFLATIDTTVQRLPQQASSTPPPAMRLATGLLPPTNKWFSSIVFSKDPQPVFAYPLSFKPLGSGFGMSYPVVTATANTIFGSHTPALSVNLGSSSYKVSRYDDLSVDTDFFDAGGSLLATITVTHGSPYIFVHMHHSQQVSITSREVLTRAGNGQFTSIIDGSAYAVKGPAQSATAGTHTATYTAASGSRMVLYAAPDAQTLSLLHNTADNAITAAAVSYRVTSTEIRTEFRVTTVNNQPTLFALPPHLSSTQMTTGSAYTTLLGQQKLARGTSFMSAAPKSAVPDAQLNLSKLSPAQREELKNAVLKDVTSTALTKPDTYSGGKELQRAAQLLLLADQLGLSKQIATLETQLQTAFDDWLKLTPVANVTDRHFYYDTTLKGIVGQQPAYGSEQFNDHHFHYGYFIYAAAVLARFDSGFAQKHGAMVNVLITDIASGQASSSLPRLRVFDPYVGHSWASGYSDFGDGNNQESVSEAINAWYATYLWGVQTTDSTLQNLGAWLYQSETASSLQYWFLNNSMAPSGYQHPTASLIWGGKTDFATFFSPRPQAALGIQLIPMSPANNYLSSTRTRNSSIINSVLTVPQDFHGQFGDYIVMYQALADPAQALRNVHTLAPRDIDDGNSYAYTLAWVLSHQP